MTVQFVHTADLHLGSPLRTGGVGNSRHRNTLREATYTAFERIIDIAIDESVDFVIVAGDLYDRKHRSVRANEFLVEQFSRLREENIPAYVIYGNHDPFGAGRNAVEFPDNVYEFDHESREVAYYPDEDEPRARIWGQSYRSESDDRSMYHYYAPDDGRIPNIGVLHTGLDSTGNRYVPCTPNDLRSKDDIHYWALGHIHQTRVRNDGTPLVYPGIPQGRQITEPGVGGCMLVTIEANDNPEIEFVPTSPLVWQTVDIPIDADDTIDGVEDLIDIAESRADTAREDMNVSVPVRDGVWEPTGYVFRWRLTGRHKFYERFEEEGNETISALERRLRERLSRRDPFVWTESVENRLGPPLPDATELEGKDRVVDEFLELRMQLRDDEEFRNQLRGNKDGIGVVWDSVDDPEEGKDTRLDLTEEKKDELITRAEQAVLDELAKRRVEQ